METNPVEEEAREIPPIVRPEKVHRKAAWPIVLGIIALAFASLTIFGVGVQVVMAAAAGFDMHKIAETQFPGLTGGLLYFGFVLMGLNLVLLVFLVAAGIGLIMRRRWGILSSRIYAVGMFLLSVLSTGLNVIGLNDLQNNPQFQNVPQGVPLQGFMIVAFVVGLLFSLGIMLGILLWLRSNAARREWTTWK